MRDYMLIAVGVMIGLLAPSYVRGWRGNLRAWKVALKALAERDRYRRALEEIAEVGGPPYPDWTAAGRAEDREVAMQRVAREALAPNQEEVNDGRV